jgi:YacP-like NYN domain-containing protein
MRVLVDGTNALHALGIDAGGLEADRGVLLRQVRSRARKATVFFDGHPPPGEFDAYEARGVRVAFSLGREADELIVDAVRDADQAGALLVVTDDLELARRATQLGARTCRVRSWFARELPAPRAEHKPAAHGFTARDFGLPEVVDLDDRSLLDEGGLDGGALDGGALDGEVSGGRRSRGIPPRPRPRRPPRSR